MPEDPAANAPPQPPPSRKTRRWFVAAAAASCVVVAAACWLALRSEPAPRIDRIPDLPEPTLVAADPGYVGPQACAECHAARVQEFRNTRHAHACWASADGPMSAPFAGESLRSIHPDLEFRMSRRDGSPTIAIRDRRQPAFSDPFPVDWIYGAGGQADEIYFAWKDDRLFELPAAWINSTKRWAEQPFNPNDPGSILRTATPRCLECHNTWFQHVLGTENEYRRESFVRGVTCEKCHGPAAGHVAFHRSHPNEPKGRDIVVPTRLDRDRQIDVCAQCHSNAIHSRGPACDFRPGDRLDDRFRSLRAAGIENDHVADQAKYLAQSACFRKSDALTCTTCHNPHRAADPAAADRTCAKCHGPQLCKEGPRLPEDLRSRCVSCHMPTYNRVAVKFHAEGERYSFPMRPHEHRIAVYPEARDEALWNRLRERADPESRAESRKLAEGLTRRWLAEASRRKEAHQHLAAIGALREAVRFDATDASESELKAAIEAQSRYDADFHAATSEMQKRRNAAAVAILERMLKAKPNDARVRGKLGTLHALLGDRTAAEAMLSSVERFDPDDPYGRNMLGWLAFLDGKGTDAAEHFRAADAIRPNVPEIQYRWGLALLQSERWSEALDRFERVRRADPRHVGSCQGTAHALSKLGRHDEAIAQARRAAQWSAERNADILLTLAESCASGGYWQDAREWANKALEAARASQPQLVPRIRVKLDQWKDRPR